MKNYVIYYYQFEYDTEGIVSFEAKCDAAALYRKESFIKQLDEEDICSLHHDTIYLPEVIPHA